MKRQIRNGALLACLLPAACNDTRAIEQVDYGYYRFPVQSAHAVHDVTAGELNGVAEWKVNVRSSVTVPNETSGVNSPVERLTYALRLPDGRFALADGNAGRVAIFDERGVPQAEWGEKGAGPDQFQLPIWLGLCGEGTLHVYDLMLQTLTIYDMGGVPIDAFRLLLPTELPPSGRAACNARGAIAVEGQLERPQELPQQGPFRPSLTISVRNAGRNEFRDVARIPGPDFYRWPNQMGPLGYLGREPSFGMSDESIFVATGDAFEIAEYGFDGTLRAVIRATGVERRPVTMNELKRIGESQLDATEQSVRAQVQSVLESMQWPDFHPVLDRLVIDPSGCLWVRQRRQTHPKELWRVLTSSGEPIGTVNLPMGFNLTQVAELELIGYYDGSPAARRAAAYRYQRGVDVRC